jgi:hypothetical protein
MRTNDRLIPLVYFAFAPLAVLTAIFGPLLVLFPESTRMYWAWEIKAPMSAVWVGASYTFGAIAIVTMLVTGRWRSAIVPVVATWLFSIVILAATIIHWNVFFLGTVNFYVWLIIYLALPVVLPLIWWLNHTQDPGPQPTDMLVPRPIVIVAGITGVALALLSLLMFFSPSTAAGFWPWQLTPLMSRTIAAWLVFVATGLLCLIVERRYIAYRPYLIPASIWFAILFIVSFFHMETFDYSRATVWVWFVATASASLVMLALFLYMERRYSAWNRQSLTPVAEP